MNLHTVYISVGSNLGDKLDNCRKGIAALSREGVTTVAAQSSFYKTDPVDYTAQDWFINAAVKILTVLEPMSLLDDLKKIQRRAGRTHDPIQFGPRILDLDIIFYDEVVIDSEVIVLPHPRMHKRRFVLKPICDIDPQLIHPVLKEDVQTLLSNLGDDTQGVERYPCDC